MTQHPNPTPEPPEEPSHPPTIPDPKGDITHNLSVHPIGAK